MGRGNRGAPSLSIEGTGLSTRRECPFPWSSVPKREARLRSALEMIADGAPRSGQYFAAPIQIERIEDGWRARLPPFDFMSLLVVTRA